MNYTPQHAERALDIMERLMVYVTERDEYSELIAILQAPNRWREAHELFRKIRVKITLPSEKRGEKNLDHYFAYVAENAAKTCYNCSHQPAPFDDDSFEWLLKCEEQFLNKANETNQEFENSFDKEFPGNAWEQGQKAADKVHWDRSDLEFFKAGACHILAHVFLETFENAGFSAYIIHPLSAERGFHVFVARGDVAFDYRGYSSREQLVQDFIRQRTVQDPKWRCDVTSLPPPVVTAEFCEQYKHRNFNQYHHDPRPRARAYLESFGAPPSISSRHDSDSSPSGTSAE
jgi:hypothetical protein